MNIQHKGSVIYSDGEITTIKDRRDGYPEILLVPQEVYFGCHNGSEIRILPVCDKSDAEAWIAAYINVCRDPNSRIIDDFYGVTYELGGFHKDHLIEAVAFGNIVRFYCVPRQPRLLCVKRSWNPETVDCHAIENSIKLQCARLLSQKISSAGCSIEIPELTECIYRGKFCGKSLEMIEEKTERKNLFNIIEKTIGEMQKTIETPHSFPPSRDTPFGRIQF